MLSPKVCVIVVTYNGIEWIEKCLRSITTSSINADTIVVDNGSTDGTLEYLQESKEVEVLFEKNENLGFGKANNVGLKEGYLRGYEYFLLLNQDAWVASNVIEELTEAMRQEDNFGITSPLHFNGSGNDLDYLFKSYLARTLSYQKDLNSGKIESLLYEAPFVNAACWMISKSTITKVGLFHPLFDHYGEDDNYIDRLHDNGLKLGLHPDLKVFHDRKQDSKNSLKNDPFRIFERSALSLLLDPKCESKYWDSFFKARKFAKQESKFLKIPTGVGFKIRCFLEYRKIWQRVKYFEENRQSELYV